MRMRTDVNVGSTRIHGLQKQAVDLADNRCVGYVGQQVLAEIDVETVFFLLFFFQMAAVNDEALQAGVQLFLLHIDGYDFFVQS